RFHADRLAVRHAVVANVADEAAGAIAAILDLGTRSAIEDAVAEVHTLPRAGLDDEDLIGADAEAPVAQAAQLGIVEGQRGAGGAGGNRWGPGGRGGRGAGGGRGRRPAFLGGGPAWGGLWARGRPRCRARPVVPTTAPCQPPPNPPPDPLQGPPPDPPPSF